jgi:hypothetical protein
MTGSWGVVVRDVNNNMIVAAVGIMVALYADRSLFINGRYPCHLFWLHLCPLSRV